MIPVSLKGVKNLAPKSHTATLNIEFKTLSTIQISKIITFKNCI